MIKDTISRHLRLMAWRLFACVCFAAASTIGAKAQPFSADIVTRRDDAWVRMGRIGVRDGKVRIETSEFPDGFFLTDTTAAKPSAYFVRPAAHIYMDARQSNRLTRLFVSVDPDVPCPQWQAMARLAGAPGEGEWRCERTGEETIDGHDAIAFRVVTGAGQAFVASIDRTRKFPLRIQSEDGVTVALEAIRDESLPTTSFELPPSLRKFSPEALVERIKQSDVWVARPANTPASRP